VIVEASGDGANVLTDPHDVAAVAARVLTTPGHEGQTYSLTAAEALTGAQIAQKISQVLDRPVTYTDISPETMSESLLAAGMPPYVVEVARDYFHMVRQGRLHPTTTIAELLGRPPRTYDEWLRENASTRMRQHGAPKPV